MRHQKSNELYLFKQMQLNASQNNVQPQIAELFAKKDWNAIISIARKENNHVFFIVPLLMGLGIAAGLIYTGYQVSRLVDPAESIANSLKDINTNIGEIANDLNNLTPKIEQLIDSVIHLIQDLQGMIKKEFLTGLVNEFEQKIAE